MSEANGKPNKRSDSEVKGCCWSITINNPTEDDNTTWSGISGLHWVVEAKGQMERGENGTLHLQGMLRTKSVRFSQVKKALPRAHIEKAKSPDALAKYVQKEDTRVSAIPTVRVATLPDLQRTVLRFALRYCEEVNRRVGGPYLEGIELLKAHEYSVQQRWEVFLDESVKLLIEQGFYGIEFVVANPQIRTAFKKYLPSILYRQYAATQVQEQQAPSPSPPEQEEID